MRQRQKNLNVTNLNVLVGVDHRVHVVEGRTRKGCDVIPLIPGRHRSGGVDDVATDVILLVGRGNDDSGFAVAGLPLPVVVVAGR